MRSRSTRRLGMDMFMMLFLAMGAILYMILPLINIPEKESDVAPPPQGNLIVELYWPNENIDVDLWVQSPGDVPVGYSNKGGIVANLLRDDLGSSADLSNQNMEITYTRGIPNGEYVVNAHLYNLKSGSLPVPIRLIVALKATDDAPYVQLFAVTGELKFPGEEKTMARFKIEDNKYVEGSFHTIKKSIRPAMGDAP